MRSCFWLEKNRNDQKTRKLGSKIYNFAIRVMTGLKINDQNCGFKVYKKHLIDQLNIYGHFHRFLPMQAHLMGYKVGEQEVQNSERLHGFSKYKTFRYEGLFDLISVLFLVRFGFSPLHFFGLIAITLIIPSAAMLAYLLGMHVLYLFTGVGHILVPRPLFTISLMTFFFGLNIFLVGLVCDFFLFHHSKANSSKINSQVVKQFAKPLGRE